jgi:hypothetical protein
VFVVFALEHNQHVKFAAELGAIVSGGLCSAVHND